MTSKPVILSTAFEDKELIELAGKIEAYVNQHWGDRGYYCHNPNHSHKEDCGKADCNGLCEGERMVLHTTTLMQCITQDPESIGLLVKRPDVGRFLDVLATDSDAAMAMVVTNSALAEPVRQLCTARVLRQHGPCWRRVLRRLLGDAAAGGGFLIHLQEESHRDTTDHRVADRRAEEVLVAQARCTHCTYNVNHTRTFKPRQMDLVMKRASGEDICAPFLGRLVDSSTPATERGQAAARLTTLVLREDGTGLGADMGTATRVLGAEGVSAALAELFRETDQSVQGRAAALLYNAAAHAPDATREAVAQVDGVLPGLVSVLHRGDGYGRYCAAMAFKHLAATPSCGPRIRSTCGALAALRLAAEVDTDSKVRERASVALQRLGLEVASGPPKAPDCGASAELWSQLWHF